MILVMYLAANFERFKERKKARIPEIIIVVMIIARCVGWMVCWRISEIATAAPVLVRPIE